MSGATRAAPSSLNFLPSVPQIIFLGVFLFLTLEDSRLLGDADTGFHIRAGEYMIATSTIPDADIFSYLTPPLKWTLHEWLSELIMAAVHRIAGLTGIVIVFAFLIATACYLVYDLLLKPFSNVLFAAVMTLLVVLASSSNWLARPHVFTLLIFVIWLYLLNGYQYREQNRLLFLPLVMLFWVNLHGGFILGLIVLSIYFVGNLSASLFAPSKAPEKAKALFLGKILVVCVLAALLNPYGYKSLLFPFQVVRERFLMDHIAEYLSPNFHSASALPFELILLAALAVFAVSATRLNLIELMLLLIFTHMALFSSRHMPLFAIVAGPVVLRHANLAFEKLDGSILRGLKQRLHNLHNIEQSASRMVWPVIGLIAVLGLALTGTIHHDFSSKHLPRDAFEFVKNNDLKGNMFNNDEFGDYIIYAGWPQYKVFIDGRTDMYGTPRVKEYIQVTQANSGWQDVLEKYNATWVMHDPNSVLSKLLVQRYEWKLVYSDKVANVFVRATPEYRDLIDKYAPVRPIAEENSYPNSQ
jgi:hypothetical protein